MGQVQRWERKLSYLLGIDSSQFFIPAIKSFLLFLLTMTPGLSSGTFVQQLVLKHPDVRKKLGLPDKEAPVTRVAHDENVKSRGTQKNPSGVVGRKTVQKLTPKELVAVGELIEISCII